MVSASGVMQYSVKLSGSYACYGAELVNNRASILQTRDLQPMIQRMGLKSTCQPHLYFNKIWGRESHRMETKVRFSRSNEVCANYRDMGYNYQGSRKRWH